MNNWNLTAVADALAGANFDRYTAACFPSPHQGIWPDDPDRFPELVETIDFALTSDRRRVFYQTLLTSFLIAPDASPATMREWISSRVGIAELAGIDCDAEELAGWSWRKVPVVLVGTSIGPVDRVKYLLVGCYGGQTEYPLYPSWAESLLDFEARKALCAAGTLARSKHPDKKFFFWPLLDPSGTASINGPSLGLSAYLGAFSAACGLEVPNLLPTGAVTSDGKVIEVDSLHDKLSAARQKRYHGFIYPVLSAIDTLSGVESGAFEKLPVRQLVEAECLWASHSPGSGHQISNFAALMQDPVKLLDALPKTEHLLSYFIKMKAHTLTQTLSGIVGSAVKEETDALLRFSSDMELVLNRPHYNKVQVSVVLELFDTAMVEQMIDRAPDAAFRIALLQIKLANHLGETRRQEQWYKVADLCYEKIPSRDLDSKKLEFLVIKFIATMHNTCSFSTQIPAQFLDEFSTIVPYLEERFRLEQLRHGKSYDIALGSYYGTMVQHYAFCGPGNLHKVEEFSAKAREAFGSGDYPQFRDDHLRQYCYLTYAYLDAKEFTKAEDALTQFLEIDGVSAFQFHDVNPFKHALVARFLADTQFEFPEYLAWCHNNMPLQGRHPWQLWLYNLGRIVKDPLQKERYWKQSVEMCLGDAVGDTMKVMALLPLSALCSSNCEDHDYIETAAQVVMKLLEAFPIHRNCLGTGHSTRKELFERLRHLEKDVQSMFPFSYR